MLFLPSSVEPIFMNLSVAFTQPTAARMAVLAVGLILARGRHTVTAALRMMGTLAGGHFSSYHRVFSRAPWSPWVLSRILTRLIVEHFPPGTPIPVAVDETTAQHKGAKVYGKGCHRDAVRSTHTHTTYKWGHKWVVVAIVIQFPFARCPWSLPVMAALYRPEKLDRAEKRRHKTPSMLARQMLATLIRWFPDRQFILVGDGGYATGELAAFCSRHNHPLVSRLRPDAALYAPPPQRKPKQTGRPRVKGRKIDSPGKAAKRKNASWKKTTVDWYGGGTRQVKLLTGTGVWYNRGRAVPIRWVYVVDQEGTHRDDCIFSTDVTMAPQQIVRLFTRRWSIEVTFEEVRAHLGFETPRQRVAKSVLRMAPFLLGLFSVISLAFADHARRHHVEPADAPWYVKSEVTFSDAIACVRRLLWEQTIFGTSRFARQYAKLKPGLRSFLLDRLSQAA